MSTEQRAEAEQVLADLRVATTSSNDPNARKARHAIVSKMLLTYPVAGASAETGRARGEAYADALDDVPPWAVAEAVKRWHRGECGEEYDYRWAPAPAVLRGIARALLAPVQSMAAHVAGLLAAVPLDEAMKAYAPSAEDRAYVAGGFRKLQAELGSHEAAERKRADRMASARMIGREADALAREAAE